LIQLKTVALVTVWTAVVATVGFLVVKLMMGVRVTEEEERQGLDISSHGERAYDM
jgi:Amt family ammonium transporter